MAKPKKPKANIPQFHTDSFGPGQPPLSIQRLMGLWLTVQEAEDIYRQFQRSCVPNRQVLWSGMLREYAQKWADRRDFQTLTTALGPLLDPSRPECPHHRKPSAGWVRYIHGASVIFAWYISQGDLVTVLSQPPPQRFHPSGLAYYQTVEEPIIKGRLGNRAVGKIVVIHPTVGGKAEEFKYEMWPHDELSLWMTNFGIPQIVIYWRAVKGEKDLKHIQVLKQTRTEPNTAPKAKVTLANTETSQPKTPRKGKKKNKTAKGNTGNGSIAEHPTPSTGAAKNQLPAVIPAASGKKKAKKKKKGRAVGISKIENGKKNEATGFLGEKPGGGKNVGKKTTVPLQTSAVKGVKM